MVRRLRGGVRARAADPAGDGQEHLPCRRAGRRAGGEDLQQHDARASTWSACPRASCLPRSWGWTGTSSATISSDATGAVLGAVELLPGAGTGARGAVQPRLRAGLHGGADGEGRETVAGRGRGDRRADAARRARRSISTRRWSTPARRQGFLRRIPLAGGQDATSRSTDRSAAGRRGGEMAADSFKAARDFLLAHRTDYAAAYRGFPLAGAGALQLGARLVRCRTGAAATPPTSRR